MGIGRTPVQAEHVPLVPKHGGGRSGFRHELEMRKQKTSEKIVISENLRVKVLREDMRLKRDFFASL